MLFILLYFIENAEEMIIENVVENDNDQFKKIDNADISLKLRNPITDLIERLRNSPMGASVLSYYRKNRTLPQNYRIILCDVILDVELRAYSEVQ